MTGLGTGDPRRDPDRGDPDRSNSNSSTDSSDPDASHRRGGVGSEGADWWAELEDLSTLPVYVISVAASLSGLHPQTLRTYDRLGLVSPGRAPGRGRRYSERDVALLREVTRLSQDGVSLPGIARILALQEEVVRLHGTVRQLALALQAAQFDADRQVRAAEQTHRRDLVPVRRDAASVVLWRRTRVRGHR